MSQRLWREQCAAARRIKVASEPDPPPSTSWERNSRFLDAADRDPELLPDVPKFVAEVATIFRPHEVRSHLPGVRQIRRVLGGDAKEAADILHRMRVLLMDRYEGAPVGERRQSARR
jgi:hypothetical protein